MLQPWHVLKHRRGGAVVLAAGSLLLGGCAALINPSTEQAIEVTSNPTDAEIWVDGKLIGTAPYMFRLDTRTTHDLTVRRGDDIRTWRLELQLFTTGGLGLAADAAVLVPGIWCAVDAFQAHESSSPWGYHIPASPGLGAACLVIGLTPIVIDVVTNHLGELHPSKIAVDFEQPPPAAAQGKPQEVK